MKRSTRDILIVGAAVAAAVLLSAYLSRREPFGSAGVQIDARGCSSAWPDVSQSTRQTRVKFGNFVLPSALPDGVDVELYSYASSFGILRIRLQSAPSNQFLKVLSDIQNLNIMGVRAELDQPGLNLVLRSRQGAHLDLQLVPEQASAYCASTRSELALSSGAAELVLSTGRANLSGVVDIFLLGSYN